MNVIIVKGRTVTLTDEEMNLLLSAATLSLEDADSDTTGYPEKMIDRVYKIANTLLHQGLAVDSPPHSTTVIVVGGTSYKSE